MLVAYNSDEIASSADFLVHNDSRENTLQTMQLCHRICSLSSHLFLAIDRDQYLRFATVRMPSSCVTCHVFCPKLFFFRPMYTLCAATKYFVLLRCHLPIHFGRYPRHVHIIEKLTSWCESYAFKLYVCSQSKIKKTRQIYPSKTRQISGTDLSTTPRDYFHLFRFVIEPQYDSSMCTPQSLLQALLFHVSICLHPSRSPPCHNMDPDTSSQTSIIGGYGIEPTVLAKKSYLRR